MSEKKTKKPSESKPFVSLIDDPFGIKTLEITQAQENSEELNLDRDLDGIETEEPAETEGAGMAAAENPESDETESLEDAAAEWASDDLDLAGSEKALDSLAKVLSEEQEAQIQVEEMRTDVDEVAAAEEELAAQIAEDQALQKEMEEERKRAEEEAKADPELLAALPKEPVAAEDGSLDLSEMQSCIETLLFMSDRQVSVDKLREYLGPTFDKKLFEQAIEALQERYQSPAHGIEVVAVGGGYQLRTKPGRAALAKKLAKVQTQRLSSGGMETLAIIAYRQPVMKEDIDKIRGVDSSYFVRGLLDRKLIKISGRSELPGRPMLYSTSDEFLSLFGLKDLSSMPSLRELEQMIPASQSDNPDEDPKVKEMRRLVEQMKADNTRLAYDPREDEKILKEIREKVQAIPSSTPYLDEQKRQEKEAAQAAKEAKEAAQAAEPAPELPLTQD